MNVLEKLPSPVTPSKFCWFISRLAVWLIVLTYALTFPGAKADAQQTPSASFNQLAAKAQKASEENRLDDAARLYAQALAINPKWAEGWWAVATLEYDQDHYAKSAAAFGRLVPLQPKNGTAFAMLGLCEFELGDAQASLHDIQKGIDLGLQTNPELRRVVLYHEGMLLQRKGSFQAAQDALEHLCLQTGPNDSAAHILGMTLLRSTAKEPPPAGSVDAGVVLRVGRAACLAGEKEYDEARLAFEAVVKDYPNYPNIHYAFGMFLLELRDITESVNQLKQEIANNPTDVVSRLRIAAAEYKLDSAAGIPFAEEAVKLDPHEPFGHYLLGLLRLDTDDYKNAIPELEIAQKAFPQEAKIFLALATAYSRDGRKEDAARARASFQRLDEGAKAGNQTSGETRVPTTSAPSLPE